MQVIVSFILFILLGACSVSKNTPPQQTITKIPAPLQKLAVGAGELSAYVQLDGSSVRIFMDINPEGNGTASVVLPGLSRTKHAVLITYEYTDSQGSFILAQINQEVDLTSGSSNLNVDASDYSLAFDQDRDGVNNATELLTGTDPRISGLINNTVVRIGLEVGTPKLTIDNINNGALRGFVTLDGDVRNRTEMEVGTVSGLTTVTLSNLSNKVYSVLITFEYTDANGVTVVVSTYNQDVDLTFGGQTIPIINASLFDFTSYDDDNDGAYNIDEIIRNSNPREVTLPVSAVVSLSYVEGKKFLFTWEDVGGDAIFYQLMENVDGVSDFVQVGNNISSKKKLFEYVVPLFRRTNAQYFLKSCNQLGCIDSATLNVAGNLMGSIGYFKIDNTDNTDSIDKMRMTMDLSGDGNTLAMKSLDGDTTIFTNDSGEWREQAVIPLPYSFIRNVDAFQRVQSISLSADGLTLAMVVEDDRNGSGIDSTVTDTAVVNQVGGRTRYHGSVYVFVRIGDVWLKQAYIKSSNATSSDAFGSSMSLSDDGNTLAVGASGDQSEGQGTTSIIDTNGLATNSGAVYVFARDGLGRWSQQAFIKASNAERSDLFHKVALSGDGLTLAVGAVLEDSGQSGVVLGNGIQASINNNMLDTGAVYMFILDEQANTWSQEAYIKASNTGPEDHFGSELSLTRNGNTLAVVADREDGGIRADQSDNSSSNFGAVYIFERDVNGWVQQDYIKPNIIHNFPNFGSAISLSGDGDMLAIGSSLEKSSAVGVNGDQSDSGFSSGAVYTFIRDVNVWIQQVYIKASNADFDDAFGNIVKLSGDGMTLAVQASGEDSNAIGINGDQFNNDALGSGAVYLY